MTDPIQSSPLVSYYPDAEGATAAENAGQLCLTTEHTPESNTPAPVPTSATASPTVSGLVARFEPSTLKAFAECTTETAGLALRIGGVALAAPETLGASLLALGIVAQASQTLIDCLEKDVNAQVDAARREREAANCQANGGRPVQGYAGGLVCLK